MANGVGTTHHVKINGQFYLIRPGTYRKQPAPLFGARFTTGDPDYNNLSFWQYWAQTCWVGGFGAPTWVDDAMFDEGVGIDASQHEVMLLSRDLGPDGTDRSTDNWDLDGEVAVRRFAVFNDKLYALQCSVGAISARLYVFDPTDDDWTLVKTFTENVQWMVPFAGYLVFATNGSNLVKMTTAEVFSNIAKPSGVTDQVWNMNVYREHLYVPFGRAIWRLKRDLTWDGSTAFYNAEGINVITQSEVHLGFLYFMSFNGHLLRTDGNNTFDIWQFEPHVITFGMRSFDGRLFVGTYESVGGTDAHEAALYQFTGAAVTELKRWGKAAKDMATGSLRAYFGKLYFGASSLLGMSATDGFGIAMYDPIEDAYHLQATNVDTAYSTGTEGLNHIVDDVFYWRGYFYCSVRGHGIFRSKFTYRDASRSLAEYDTTPSGSLPPGNGGWFTSSEFDAGTPGLLKLWNAITVHVDLPSSSTGIDIEYSIDGGQNWVYVGQKLGDGTTLRFAETFLLATTNGGTTPLRAPRFKYRITMISNDTTESPQLRGVIVRYLPLPEPNWQWSFNVILSDRQHLLDGTIDDVSSGDLASLRSALETPFRAGTLVNFVDIDGTSWASSDTAGVLITSLIEEVRAPVASSEGAIEADYRVVLTEAVEDYPDAA